MMLIKYTGVMAAQSLLVEPDSGKLVAATSLELIPSSKHLNAAIEVVE